jgi:Ca2+-binding EF-hand superfamily protein
MERNKKIILGIVIAIITVVAIVVVVSIVTNPYYGLKNQQQVEANFRLYDQNNDGYLDINDLEYRANSPNMMGTAEDPNITLQKYDTNNDGKINLTECDNWMG